MCICLWKSQKWPSFCVFVCKKYKNVLIVEIFVTTILVRPSYSTASDEDVFKVDIRFECCRFLRFLLFDMQFVYIYCKNNNVFRWNLSFVACIFTRVRRDNLVAFVTLCFQFFLYVCYLEFHSTSMNQEKFISLEFVNTSIYLCKYIYVLLT